jgi:hypothetical protein
LASAPLKLEFVRRDWRAPVFCEGFKLLPEARLAGDTELAVEAIEEARFCEDKLRAWKI